MKTIKKWLDELPQPYRFEAINNSINQFGTLILNVKTKNLSMALISAFKWDQTDEGGEYWDELHTKIIKDENN